jgi:hypothetical protein
MRGMSGLKGVTSSHVKDGVAHILKLLNEYTMRQSERYEREYVGIESYIKKALDGIPHFAK